MKIAFDATLKRPACAILAAALGADHFLSTRFPTSSWLVHPTDDMKVYSVDEEQLAYLVEMVDLEHSS